MDQVKVALAIAKKYYFWVLSGLILVIGLLSWATATSNMAGSFNKRKSVLETQVNDVRSIWGRSNHPNDGTIQSIKDQHGRLGDNVYRAWMRLYEQQRADNPLPDFVGKIPGFKEAFEKRWGALEKLDPSDEMEQAFREKYLNQIKLHLPKLDELLDRRMPVRENLSAGGTAPKEARGFGGEGGSGAPPARYEGTVFWNDSGKVLKSFSELRTIPRTLDLMMAQEDLWVYEALLRVIRRANNMGNDPNKYVAPSAPRYANVKRLIALDIGQDAARDWQATERSVVKMPVSTSGPGEGGGGGGDGPPPGTGEMPGRGGAAGAGPGGTTVSPLAGRYVDDHGRPLTDPTQQPYAEFRMMPIDMRVVIEQKAIPRLLAECANSNMPIDVRDVRIVGKSVEPLDLTTEGDGQTAGGRVGDESGGRLRGLGAEHGGGMGTHGGGEAKGSGGDQDEDTANPLEPPVTVEVQGIIYIYNPPDRSKLGTGTAGGAVMGGGETAGPAAKPTLPATGGPDAGAKGGRL